MVINHLGIIPDGNRRWAKCNGKSIDYAYQKFSNNIINIISDCNSFKINELSLYLISKENLHRAFSDVSSVLTSIKSIFPELDIIAKNNDLRIVFPGIENINDNELCALANDMIDKTKSNNNYKVNLLIGYNPFDEIQLALKKSAKISIIDLSVNTYVDLIIRTAGAPVRLSNFLPLQSGYANIEVLNKYFIDLTKEDIIAVIDKYKDIMPNYGK